MKAAGAFLAVLALAACSDEAPGLDAHAFDCGETGPTGTLSFVADQPETAILTLDDETQVLSRVRTASGAKYGNAATGMSVWTKGAEMRLELPSGEARVCSLSH